MIERKKRIVRRKVKKTTSAGGIVLNTKGKVLVVSQRGTSWSLPKGHVEKGEKLLQAARREIAEESGITRLKYVRRLGKYQRNKIGKGGVGEDRSELKTIVIFLFTTTQKKLQPLDAHNPTARWLKAEKVPDLLTHPKDRSFFLKQLPAINKLAPK